ncbi:MAG TPA: CPBP family intramembrane metalloprotease [Burkholderiaceae bacterium]|nr:CPBP family intramembrane metalloprotease [Burkholderiaceae bacterium]
MTQAPAARRLTVSLMTYVAWTLVTVFGMRWASDGTQRPLIESVTHGISWNLVMAVALLAVVTVVMRWRDLKFVAPAPMGSLRVLWFPALYLLFFASLPAVIGLPPARTLLFVIMNTMLVGLSEEWMFRGVLFQGLRSRLALWPAILLTSALFGAVHVMNVVTTGQLGEAVVQAVAAFMSGMVMIALLIRTGSIWVPIVYHALWDFGTFVVSVGSAASGPPIDVTQGWNWTLPMLMVLPNFLFALFLLRGVRNDTRLATD